MGGRQPARAIRHTEANNTQAAFDQVRDDINEQNKAMDVSSTNPVTIRGPEETRASDGQTVKTVSAGR